MSCAPAAASFLHWHTEASTSDVWVLHIVWKLVFFCVNSGPEAHHVYPNGDEVSNFEIVYLCRNYHGEPKNTDGEMEELRFFAPEEIDLEMISPPIRPVLRRYIEQLA